MHVREGQGQGWQISQGQWPHCYKNFQWYLNKSIFIRVKYMRVNPRFCATRKGTRNPNPTVKLHEEWAPGSCRKLFLETQFSKITIKFFIRVSEFFVACQTFTIYPRTTSPTSTDPCSWWEVIPYVSGLF